LYLIKKKYDVSDTSQGVKFLKAVAGVLRALSPVEADLYIKKVAKENGISEGALRREVNGEQQVEVAVPKEEKAVINTTLTQSQIFLEKTLIRLSLLQSSYFERLRDFTEAFSSAEGIKIYSILDGAYEKDKEFDIDKIKDNLESSELNYLAELLDEIKIGANDEQAFNDCIAKLEKLRKDKRKKEIQDILDIASGEGNTELQDKLLKEYMDLQR